MTSRESLNLFKRCSTCKEEKSILRFGLYQIKGRKTKYRRNKCHETGRVRGLLCWNCNIGIGYLKHKTEILRKAIEYLGG